MANDCVFSILKELATWGDVVTMSSWLDILVELSRDLVGSDARDVREGATIAVFAMGELLVVFAEKICPLRPSAKYLFVLLGFAFGMG